MSNRNLTELYFLLRNNFLYSKNVYSDEMSTDNVALLDISTRKSVQLTNQPNWIGKYEEIQFLISKIETRIEDLLRIHDTKVRSVLNEDPENELKHVTKRFRQSHTAYINEQNNTQQKSKAIFQNISTNVESVNSVDTFDNFLNLNVPGNEYDDNDDDKLDQYFQLPASGKSINQKQLMMIEADNTKSIQNREQEVARIVNSIEDLNTVFKDLSQLVQEQGTIVDRIDFNIESTQTRVLEGYKQLQKAENYQRKNKKIYCILMLASMIMFMIVLTIFTKF
ncbi:syntaxin-16 isoform X3 [Topomyia yanbarensis]|uniref:syntaxin-16 isoform X3 n=1 Tax=Topomyia yanbarensis TaxID=2498891 RepID=UPI00273C5945|nr:syntaxin-16 isoform X3 [Topomyia yanbarensis]